MDQQISILENVSDKAIKTANRYSGDNALYYESKRIHQPKWRGEDFKVKIFLKDMPKGTSVLDIPCGHGRFFAFYWINGFKVIGMDISPDMIREAQRWTVGNIETRIGNIFNIDTCTIFDVVMCIRFLNLIEANDVKLAMKEMQRVGRRIIFTLRVKQKNPTGHYHTSHSISLIEESLLPGWKISRNEPVHEEDYRMIEVIDEMG